MRQKTGEVCSKAGNYKFDGYVNAPVGTPKPTSEESMIQLKSGGTFPPVNSTDQAAWWVFIG
jgi:hypothetical protein